MSRVLSFQAFPFLRTNWRRQWSSYQLSFVCGCFSPSTVWLALCFIKDGLCMGFIHNELLRAFLFAIESVSSPRSKPFVVEVLHEHHCRRHLLALWFSISNWIWQQQQRRVDNSIQFFVGLHPKLPLCPCKGPRGGAGDYLGHFRGIDQWQQLELFVNFWPRTSSSLVATSRRGWWALLGKVGRSGSVDMGIKRFRIKHISWGGHLYPS